ncbi:hypothetical protein [Mycobacterium ostraviense]|uniref:Uncharacterized protein n=1 Tax=Mycobacterium ostraviense TaxID=2738409 RepID=A0A164B3P2_9MYCO|nr:hypothetical protein [Mycobacterium ostraviense]KZS63083.1 hypothetical protein A4G28_04420 [Mycobacterium ostraviense]
MSPLTAVVPVSVIPSNPDISIVSETLDSIRFHHPDAPIVVTFDGVRAEQEHRREAYEEAIRRILWRCDKVYGGVVPWIFEEPRHQIGMLRAVMDEIRTDLLMYVESDTPITTDEPIDWDGICEFIRSGEANLVRLAHESHWLEAHAHLGHGLAGNYLRVSQWSQRPHVASKAYYRRILDSHFSPDAYGFIEDKMHSVLEQAHRLDGLAGWRQHSTFLYHPDGGNIKRSYHLDGRAGAPKFDADQRF